MGTKSALRVAGVGLAVAAGAVAATVVQAQASNAPDVPAANDPGPVALDIVRERSPEQRKSDEAALSPEARGSQQRLEQQLESGRIGVAGPTGFVGYVESAALNYAADGAEPRLYPVVDDNGSVVAYYTAAAGVVDKELVESGAPIDLEAVRRSNGFGE